MKTTACFVAFGALFAASPCAVGQVVEEDVISIPRLVALCESCHGPRGRSQRPDVPSLAGQPVDSVVESMNAFYFKERHCPGTRPDSEAPEQSPELDMCNISGSLSQTEKVALAEHFAAQPPCED